jgi:hypothetical protein
MHMRNRNVKVGAARRAPVRQAPDEGEELVYSVYFHIQVDADKGFADPIMPCYGREALKQLLTEYDEAGGILWDEIVVMEDRRATLHPLPAPTRLGRRTMNRITGMLNEAGDIIRLQGKQPDDGLGASLEIHANVLRFPMVRRGVESA